MSASKPMTDEGFEAVAQRFRVLSDPMRLKILCSLVTEELTVSRIVERTGGSQSNVSKHLATLLTHGLVKRRREGTSVYYSITDPAIFDLCNQVCDRIDRDLEKRRRALK
jgi:DNA-binding transcriptional ArsR family regulator